MNPHSLVDAVDLLSSRTECTEKEANLSCLFVNISSLSRSPTPQLTFPFVERNILHEMMSERRKERERERERERG
jgi:hypothetical protein